MKTKSIFKAIGSGLIWGLGQLFNKQYLKALFFFVIFGLFIGLELGTSKYFVKEEVPHQFAYDKIQGVDFGDSWFEELPLTYYQDLKLATRPADKANIKSESFENYLNDMGILFNDQGLPVDPANSPKFTEEIAIQFFASELRRTSPELYTNLASGVETLEADFSLNGYSNLITKETLYQDVNGLFYVEINSEQEDGSNKKEYIETSFFTGIVNDPIIKDSLDGLTKYVKSGTLFKATNDKIYLEVGKFDEDNNQIKLYVELMLTNNIIFQEANASGIGSSITKIDVFGPIYANETETFEYYKPGLIHNGHRQQYNSSTFMNTFRRKMGDTYQHEFNEYRSADYERLMLKVYFELNHDVKDEYIKYHDNFFFDKAGIFTKGYWSVMTLGVAKKQDYRSYRALEDAMLGSGNDIYKLDNINLTGSIPIHGHISTMLLLEGLIAIILSLFFFIFMFWSIRDAYQTSEKRRLEKEVLNDKEYFKHVWDQGFEYIILSPALFVLAFISIMPIAFGFILAFTSISGNQSMVDNFNWVGFKNFFALFNFTSGLGASFGKAFWRVSLWTLIWAVLSTATVFFGGFIQALILNSEKIVFRKLWRTILILPWAIPALLSQMVFSVMFKETGFINQLLGNIGLYDVFIRMGILGKPFAEMTGFIKHFWLGNNNIQWFTNSYNVWFVKMTLVVVNIWLGFPYFMALMTGIMTSIDKTLYEAAEIDGATGFQKITQITIPLVLYSTAPILILTFSGNFNNFGVIYFITGGGPNEGLASLGYAGSTDILISWMYNLTVEYSIYNMASVFSVLVFFFVGSITAWNLSKTRAFTED